MAMSIALKTFLDKFKGKGNNVLYKDNDGTILNAREKEDKLKKTTQKVEQDIAEAINMLSTVNTPSTNKPLNTSTDKSRNKTSISKKSTSKKTQSTIRTNSHKSKNESFHKRYEVTPNPRKRATNIEKQKATNRMNFNIDVRY